MIICEILIIFLFQLWNPLGGRSSKDKKSSSAHAENNVTGTKYTIINDNIATNGGNVPAKTSHQSRLSIFSSFSKGKAGILAGDTGNGGVVGGGKSGGDGADPVLLGIRVRSEGEELQESIVQYNQNGVRYVFCHLIIEKIIMC